MPRNATDWVVSPESWTPAQNWDAFPADTGSASSLTLPKSLATAVPAPTLGGLRKRVSAPEIADEWTCVRVIGESHFMLDVPVTGATWKAILDVRIEILDTEPLTGVPLLPLLGFDLTEPVDANRSFMDHKSWTAYRDSTWTDIAIHQKPYAGTFSWDIRVKRRLLAHQTVGMVTQWTVAQGAVATVPTLQIAHRIRILASFDA